MANRVKLNYKGFKAIRQSAPVMHKVTLAAKGVADRANMLKSSPRAQYGYAVAQTTSKGSIALASTKGSAAAKRDNAKHNTLLKAVIPDG
ncbi:hypothetical protein [Bifidobacterium biavatii]|uniref:Uncharacterized protein n=1 Tax=Bifidobacterium biavatii DSM 23969 TaxID=1437608 RepID=A0A086ZU15_9BIFI|nr:hypothetical protein [Bifidobacterium biavatii]KFI50015.1 hypothetical protein BBIA_2148 [Bifidobacterium biavatii DSM 23969]